MRAFVLTVALGVVALFTAPGSALAAAGDLDPTFSGDGRAMVREPGVGAGQVAVDSEGRIVTMSFARILRFTSGGSLDPSFSGDGVATPPFNGDMNGLALDSHDRIVIAGEVANPKNPQHFEFAVAVLRPNGTLDPSFSGDGRAMTPIGDAQDDIATDVAIDPQGRIVVSGFSDRQDGSFASFTLVRYLPNGSLDSSFSGDGRLQQELPGVANAEGEAVALDSKGRIVVAGSGDGEFAVARFTSAGRLDPTFSGDGSVTTSMDPAGRESDGEAIAIDDFNRIVVVGDAGRITRKMAIARYRPNGSLDPSFSADGKVLTSFNRDRNYGSGVAIDDHQRIVATGSIYNLGGSNPATGLARFTPDGALDPAFSGDGRVMASLGPNSRTGGLALDASGRILVAGYSADGQKLEQVVARFLGG
jgi:uncharacterized delta-60 repeat protein